MSRRSYLQQNVPVIDANLGMRDRKISRQRKTLPTTEVDVNRLPPLSSCLKVRAKLQNEAEKMTTDECNSFKRVAIWEFYGTFTRDDISTMVAAHEVREIRRMVMEEERWFLEIENMLIDESSEEKIEAVCKFRDLIWTKSAEDVVLHSEEKCGIRVNDLCSMVCNRWLTDDLLDFLFQAMNMTTRSHYFQVLSEPLMFSDTFMKRFLDILKGRIGDGCLQHIHFAVNVRKCEKTGIVSVGRGGNHCTYFSCSVTSEEMLYGDSLGWPIPENLFSKLEPIFELIWSPATTKAATIRRPTVMHAPNSLDFNGQHECGAFCHQAFPRQKCGNICGFNPLFMCSLAATMPHVWKSIVSERDPSLSILRGVSRLTNLTENSSLSRVEVISWLINGNVNLSPLILDYTNLPQESLSKIQNVDGESIKCKGEFSLFFICSRNKTAISCLGCPKTKG